MPITQINPLRYDDWVGNASVCGDPGCRCQKLTIDFQQGENREDVIVDLAGPSVGTNGDPTFARQFGSQIDHAQINLLGQEFRRLKNELYARSDLTGFRFDFPFLDIEEEGLLIGYNEVLPYHQLLIFGDGPRFIASDAYCLLPHCDCTSALAIFFEYDPGFRGDPTPLFEIDLNVQEGVSTVTQAASGVPTDAILASWLAAFDYPTLAERRATLRALYKWNRDRFYMDLNA